MKRSVRLFGSLFIILVVLIFSEIMAYLTTSILIRNRLFFCPLLITETYENYQRRLEPNWGWPRPNYASAKSEFYDASGSRRIPAFPDPNQTPPLVCLYGDSFTEAYGVGHEHAWGNVLSQLLNCRVSNFGISGYGTDQAFLRFLHLPQDHAKVVILGVFSENIKRNVNQLRNLISTAPVCETKPRFILDNRGKLTLVPIPALTEKEYYEMPVNPGLYLHHEFFLPGGPSGRQKAQFPYVWGILKISPIIFRDLVLGDGFYQYFYQPTHPSKALEVTAAIIEEFCRTAQARGKQPVVLIIPTDYDILTYQRQRKWWYQPLVELLSERHLEFIDAGPKIIQYLGGADRETLYSPQINNHLNEAGNRLLAHIVYDFLTANNFLKR
jgi:hypothetical protein